MGSGQNILSYMFKPLYVCLYLYVPPLTIYMCVCVRARACALVCVLGTNITDYELQNILFC